MSTFSLLDEMRLKAPAWNREGNPSLASMLDRAQRQFFKKPCNRNMFIDRVTGDYPFLETTEAKLDYDIPNLTIKLGGINRTIRWQKIHEIVVRNSTLQDYNLLEKTSIIRRDGIDKKALIVIDGSALEATQVDKAIFVFADDPGTELTRYRIRGIIEPLRITNDTIPLMVDEEWEQALLDGALGYIEYYDYGRSDRMQTFQDHWLPKYWLDEDRGAHREKKVATRIRVL